MAFHRIKATNGMVEKQSPERRFTKSRQNLSTETYLPHYSMHYIAPSL